MNLRVRVAPSFTALGGMPFLDDGFDARRLLAMTAAVRHVDAEQRGIETGISDRDIEAWLAPSRAYLLGTSYGPIPALPLPPGQFEQVADALRGIAGLIPAWALLVRLPVRYASLYPPSGAISASSTSWLQHVLLADEAFASSRELREQVIHELAHQWLYLIQALWPLDQPSAALLTLPSGTTHRTPAEVLGAAHVAAALLRFYQVDGSAWAAARIQALTAYGAECLEIAASADHDLTLNGNLVAQRLKEAF